MVHVSTLATRRARVSAADLTSSDNCRHLCTRGESPETKAGAAQKKTPQTGVEIEKGGAVSTISGHQWPRYATNVQPRDVNRQTLNSATWHACGNTVVADAPP